MKQLFWCLAASLIYGLLGAGLVWLHDGYLISKGFLLAFVKSFNILVCLGIILSTAWILLTSQRTIPDIIADAFEAPELPAEYYEYRRRYLHPGRSLVFASAHIIGAWIIYSLCQFPMNGLPEALLMIASCAQWGLGAYVGRKLFYAGMMLQSLIGTRVSRNLFEDRKLDDINTYVHILSTLTIIFVYVHVRSYYPARFLYSGTFGESAKILLILPAIIATPVLLIFNFYPRVVLRRLYGASIDVEIKTLQEVMRREELSAYEKRSYIIAFEKMARDELRYSFQLALSDLPVGIVILVMILEPLIKRQI